MFCSYQRPSEKKIAENLHARAFTSFSGLEDVKARVLSGKASLRVNRTVIRNVEVEMAWGLYNRLIHVAIPVNNPVYWKRMQPLMAGMAGMKVLS